MLWRAVGITGMAVALSAAGALAFAPGLSRVSRAWTHGIVWSARGFTPVPSPHDSAAMSRDPSLDNEGGVPGTFCPTRPHDPNMSVGTAPDQHMSTEPALGSSTTTSSAGKSDLLAPAMCNAAAPETTHATPARRSILP